MSCAKPFNGFFTNGVGQWSPCCYISIENDAVPDNQYVSLPITEDPNDYINHPLMVQLRREHLTGNVTNQQCIDCMNECNSTDTDYEMLHGAQLVNYDRNTGEVDLSKHKFERVNIALSNKCNLACRMCHYKSSNTFGHIFHKKAKVHEVIAWESDRYDTNEVVRVHNAFTPSTFDSASELIDSPITLSIHGGEPFLDPQLIPLLDNLADCTDVTISTNGTVCPTDELVAALERHEVTLQFSIDGYQEDHEAIRIGASFDDIMDNAANWQAVLDVKKMKLNTVASSHSWETLGTLFSAFGEFELYGFTEWNVDLNYTWDWNSAEKALDRDQFEGGRTAMMHSMLTISKKPPSMLRDTLLDSLRKILAVKWQGEEKYGNILDEINSRVDRVLEK